MDPMIEKHRAEIATLCRRHGVSRLELFGSAASGRNRPGASDLDFLVEFIDLPAGAYADAWFGLRESLAALFDRPVDLVSGASLDNPYFRESVERTKALLYAA